MMRMSAHHSCCQKGLESCLITGMARAAQGVVNSIVVQPVFAGERAVCYRERAAGMYAVLPFSLSLVHAPRPFVQPPWVTGRQERMDQYLAGLCFGVTPRVAIALPSPDHDCPGCAQVGVELVYNAVQALLYTLIVFYMVGFDMNGSSTGAAQ